MNSELIIILALVAAFFTTALSFGLLLLLSWQPQKNRLTYLVGGYMLMSFLIGGINFWQRIGAISPEYATTGTAVTLINTVLFSLAPFLLYLAIKEYTGAHTLTTRFVAWSSGLFAAAMTLMALFRPSMLFANYNEVLIGETGRIEPEFTAIMFAALFIGLFFEISMLILVLRYPLHTFARWSIILIFVSSILEMITITRELSLAMFAAAVARVFLVYALLDDTLFHPLQRAKDSLEVAYKEVELKVQERTNSLNDSLKREQALSQQLETAVAKETELNQLKTKIIEMISHEFRTPLTVINSSSDLLEYRYEKLSTEKRLNVHKRIRNAVFYINDLLKDITFTSKDQEAGIQLQIDTYTLHDICILLTQAISAIPDVSQDVTIVDRLDHEQIIQTDAHLLTQLFLALYTNAVKYSQPASQIKLTFESTPTQFIFAVQDHGIGIDPADVPHIFDMFYRGKNVDNRRGIGLGLHTASRISEALEGEISVISHDLEIGAIFSVNLPLNPSIEGALVQNLTRAL